MSAQDAGGADGPPGEAVEPAPEIDPGTAADDDLSADDDLATDSVASDLEDWPTDEDDWIEELDDVGPSEPAEALADPAVDWRPVLVAPTWGLEIAGIAWRPSLEIRARSETRIGSYLGPPEQSLITSRARVGLEARWRSVRGLLQIQDARDFGVTPGAPTGATTGIHQGFLEVGDGRSYVRLGRQEIDWGSGRLIGSLNWQSAARSFDALRMRGEIHQLAMEGLVSVIRAPGPVTSGTMQVDSAGDWLGGFLLEWIEPEALRLATYFLFRHDGPIEAPAGTSDADARRSLDRRRDILAWSLRGSGRIDRRFRYEVELISEFGTVDSEGFVALAAIVEAGYRFIDVPWQPEIGIGLTYGTGNSPGGAVDELDNFFPSNHAIYGLMDLFGLRNQAQTFVRLDATPDPHVTGWIAARLFWLVEPAARWSNAGGRTVGVDPTNTDGLAGGEVDVELRWAPIEHVTLSAGYALFVPGGGAAALGHPAPMHFVYVMPGLTLP